MFVSSEMEILAIYNVDSEFYKALSATTVETLSLATYECQRCRMTHGLTHIGAVRGADLESLSLRVQTSPRNEFCANYPARTTLALPAILFVSAGMVVRLDAATIRETTNITVLIEKLNAAITDSKFAA